MSEMKELFIKRQELVKKALKDYYNDMKVFKTKSDAIYHIERLTKELKKNLQGISYTLENYFDLTININSYKAIDTLLENEQYLENAYFDIQAELEALQGKYFNEITKILRIKSITNYIENTIMNWQLEFKEFDTEDIENLVDYAVDITPFDREED